MDFEPSYEHIYEDEEVSYSNNNEKSASYYFKNIAIDISKFPKKTFSEVSNIPFYDVTNFLPQQSVHECHTLSYSELNYYAYKYTKLNKFHPSTYRFDNFEINKFVKDLFNHIKVPDNAFIKISKQSSDEIILSSILIAFSKDLILYIDSENSGIIYYRPGDEYKENSFFYTLLGLIRHTKKPKVQKNKIYIVYRGPGGFEKMGFNVKKVNIDLKKNYNDDFLEFSEKIILGLNDKNKTNLVILSGAPGVGKTSFIRYLTSKIKKNIIFISPDMVDSITDPAFIPFLMRNNDSVLIIEDAEPALEKRGQGGRSSAVSNVLNLTDGLLSDCLKISIVATFNTSSQNIDDALMRKGRLLMNYKFDKLSIEKSKDLLQSLGHNDVEVKEPMALSDIYYYGSENNTKTPKIKVGFKI